MSSPEPGQELARRSTNTLSVMSDAEINRSWRLAEALAQSGTFPDVKEAAKAFAIMLVGHDLGMTPTQALMGIYMVEGKPQIAATTLGGFVRARGYDYRIVEHTDKKCSIEFGPAPAPRKSKPWADKDGVSEFTMSDAERAGLVKEKSGWRRYPKNMLFARAMSNGVKWYCPDALGGVPVYTEGDEFTVRAALTAGSGSDEPQGIDLGPKVEKVLARAESLGHAGLASRATAEMTLAHRSPEKLGEWAARAEAELDQFEAEQQPPEAEVVDGAEGVTPDQMKAAAMQLRAEADAAEAEGNIDDAQALRVSADEINAKAEGIIEQGAVKVEGRKVEAGPPA